ncbi:sialate O-acetylesterase [Flavobacterium sp. ZE23DGlu08]|jgi:sialate O-acetylesterase|uniref:sialate O-acetylesterase n=1 Tax=Flavobacterium sp. ZE23DGlu08 TaxID=3059026 RepID=UPI00265FEA17|nr:sialate O-acetylesterase [Flavobacterium sp. ZE23DGlu08]WKL43709.1 sialate O-acetylesterase [Flavobacterium sp. ZE23DGlu08]
MKNNIIAFVLLLILCHSAFANVTLPNVFSDNMVLQRNTEVSIWGWANPQEEVVVTPSWDHETYKIKASNQAKWEIKMPTPKEGGPYTISIKGYNEIVLTNILIGEVWICSGQSNMEMSASWGIENGDEAVKKAANPIIRFFSIPKLTATSPQNNVSGNWTECTPATMKYFSASAYFFANRLQEELQNVPIGLISSSWGGTPAEIWMPEEIIQNDAVLLESAKTRKEESYGPNQAGRAFNAMIYPLVGFKIAGVIWYQGESNVGSAVYDKTFAALITSWRKLWNYEFPFYYVQIAPYQYGENHFGGAEIRNAQRKVLKVIRNTGMVVTTDISTIDDIHPKNKKSVGTRLANLALVKTYKANSDLVNGPLYKGIKIEKNKVIVAFDHAEGLHSKDEKSSQFEIAATDNVFYKADARIKGNTVLLQSKKVKHPVKVRFSWKNTAQSDLFNKANLPASSFITE